MKEIIAANIEFTILFHLQMKYFYLNNRGIKYLKVSFFYFQRLLEQLLIKSIKDYKYEILNNEHLFKGILISLRLRNNKVEHFYDYIDFYLGKRYEYKGDLE